MHIPDVGMIAANTARSGVYLQALGDARLLPCFALVLQEQGRRRLPGQSPVDETPGARAEAASGGEVGEIEIAGQRIRPEETLFATLERYGVPHEIIASADINSAGVIDRIASRPESTLIYSGYGGQILRDRVLGLGKRFLHVHGGYLPDFKGSTTNYYSLLEEDACGASSLFLTAEIDGGPILVRRRFAPPEDRQTLDYLYDPALRAAVLVETLRRYVDEGDWRYELEDNRGGATYFIVHPLLKHIAILARPKGDR